MTTPKFRSKPIRIQRRRTQGWRMPENTVYVGRPTIWGNPFIPGEDNPFLPGRKVADLRHAFVLYRSMAPMNKKLVEPARKELRGKNLACWCPVELYAADGYCHADVLLEIANKGDGP